MGWTVRPDAAPANMDWGIKVALDGSKYGMSPSGVTTLGFEISGGCLDNECDVLFGFGTEEQYVTLGLALDNSVLMTDDVTKGTIWIYPSNSGGLAEGDVGSLVSGPLNFGFIREDLAGGDRANWQRIAGNDDTSQNGQGDFPLDLKIISDAEARTTEFIVSFGDRSARYLYSGCTGVFAANEDLILAFTSDNNEGEGIEVSSITVARMSESCEPTPMIGMETVPQSNDMFRIEIELSNTSFLAMCVVLAVIAVGVCYMVGGFSRLCTGKRAYAQVKVDTEFDTELEDLAVQN